jgi:hypothetical protein
VRARAGGWIGDFNFGAVFSTRRNLGPTMKGSTLLPNVRGHWALRSYEEFVRKPPAPYDLVYYDDDGNEIAYMVLLLQPNGSFAYQSSDVYMSHQPSHVPAVAGTYQKRNRAIMDAHYDAIRDALMALGDRLISGEEKPRVLALK